MPDTNVADAPELELELVDAEAVEEDEEEFELVTNARQLAPPPTLRTEKVTLKDWPTVSGKPARFILWEMTASDYEDFFDAGRIYKDGSFVRYSSKFEDIRFLAWTVRDQYGNRLWSTVEIAKAQLGGVGRATLNQLLNAANRVNSAKVSSSSGNSD
ncbi:MAG TPA: hypothetical protein VH084_22020 [Mycobacterium sp.]|jgi:hypothetical protein|nr:hypothetical protein [Mycobacterium sp.]